MWDRSRTRTPQQIGIVLLGLLALLLLSSCGSDGEPDPTPTPEPTQTPSPTATAVPETSLGEVTWSTSLTASGAPDGSLGAFSRESDVIHASVEASHLLAGEMLTATWSINGMPVETLDSTVTIDEDTSSGWATFSLTWDGAALWPTGTLEVMITTSTGVSTTGSIQIVSGQ